jgi:Heterokaryon incompatibility protein (HET)
VTRLLEIRYLWIDSLCIIQDSTEDWGKEFVKMPQTYQNSTVTIAGPAASSCCAGFLDRQPQPAFPEFDIAFQSRIGQDTGLMNVSYTKGVSSLGLMPEINSVLSKRAWILQGRLLSRRVP